MRSPGWGVAAVALALTPGPALAEPTSVPLDGPDRDAQALTEVLDHTHDPLAAAAAILQLGELLPSLSRLPNLQQSLDNAAYRPSLAGEAAALAQQLSAQVLVARGRPERAAEAERALGVVQTLSVLGPLDWSSTQPCGLGQPVPSLDSSMGPSTGPKTEPPAAAHATWRALPDIAPLGRVVVEDLVSDRRDEAAVLAFSVTVPAATRAALYYGASAPSALALNGRWVAADPARHPEHFAQLRVPLSLTAGRNVVELELCRADRPLVASLRVADDKGRPLAALTRGLGFADTPVRSGVRTQHLETPERGGLLFAQAEKSDPAAAATMAEALTPFDERERRPVKERERACAAAQVSEAAACDLRLAHDREVVGDRAGWRLALDAAHRADAAAPRNQAALELAEVRAAEVLGYPDRALLHARQAAALDPTDSRAALAVAQALEGYGLSGLAGAAELAAAQRWPESPDVLSAAAYRLERLHREPDAIALLRRELALRNDLLGSHEALQRLLLRQGDVQGALDQLAAIADLTPASPHPDLDQGKLLLANAQSLGPAKTGEQIKMRDRAESAFTRAAKLAPADADVWGEIAAARLRDGDHESGRAALDRALAIAPQSAPLRALDEADAAHSDPFARGELQDLRKVAAANKPETGIEGSADAVSLADVTVVKVYASGLSSRVHQSIIRVQTQRGAEANRTFPIDYSPTRQDLHIEAARILDANGDIVEDYQDQSRSLSEPWYDLYYDLREEDLSFPRLAPGDVLEVTYRLDDSARENLIAQDFGDFLFLQDSLPHRSLVYAVQMPKGRELYDNHPQLPGFRHDDKSLPDGAVVHRFTAQNVPRAPSEPDMPGFAEVAPYLHVSTQEKWETIGDYFWSLAREQLAASPGLDAVVKDLAAQAGSDPGKRIAAAYDFVVSKTRYVGLEFGIHGYQPYPVSDVLARGFGDCKDKASLLVALLKELGVPADLVLLRTRHLGRIVDQPASLAVFDHAIVYVPSIDRFLDGTARFFGSRELPTEDQGATALVVEPGHSRLVVTPVLPAATNVTDTSLTFHLSGDGSAHIEGQSFISGEMAPEYRRAYAADVGQRSSFEAAWSRSYPGLAVDALKFKDLEGLEHQVALTFALQAPRLSQRAQEFRPFGLVSAYLETYAPLSRRQFPLQLAFPFVTRFNYRCLPPPSVRLRPPPSVHLATAFGSLDITYSDAADGSVLAAGALSLDAARVEPKDYPAFRDFLRQVDQAFDTPIAEEPATGKAADARP